MPFPTSDFRHPVCMEMKTLRTYGPSQPTSQTPSAVDMGRGVTGHLTPRYPAELGSVDSSDTYASCHTHPFNSKDDLSSDNADASCAMVDLALDSNLYVNPFDHSSRVGGGVNAHMPLTRAGLGVKKSASGDTALRSLGASPMEESYAGFGGPERGSRGSLNDSPLPKHRKTRFQQGTKPRTRFGDDNKESEESLETKKSRRSSFMPTRSLASATRIINQHLFGLQTLGGSRSGKNGGSKSSLSVDSIDSPNLEQHRRSKSILKKSDQSSHHRNGSRDPEMEKLISDNTSGASVSYSGSGGGCDPGSGSGSDYSPNRLPMRTPMSPLPTRQIRTTKSTTKPHALPIKFVTMDDHDKSRRLKSPMLQLDDILRSGEKTEGGRYRERGGCVGAAGDGCCETPLYICPPPPPMDDHSPTEETKLLSHPLATPGAGVVVGSRPVSAPARQGGTAGTRQPLSKS